MSATMFHADLYFRTFVHTVLPLHQALVEEMCRSARPPLELAAVLEDIGRGYMRMAEALNGELIRSGQLDDEPEEVEDYAESRIAQFADALLTSAGPVIFADGTRLDGRAILQGSPAVGAAIRTAVLLARSRLLPQRYGYRG